MRLRPESRIGGAACKSSAAPTRCTGRLRFFVWKQPFRSGRIAGDTCCPPSLGGRRRARISVAGARLRFAEPSQSGRRLCCKASCPNASLHSYPDDVSRRRFNALCDAGRQAPLRGGVPLAEVRRVPPPMDAVVFGASVKIYLRGIWDRNILFIRRRLKIRPHPVRSGSISRLQRVRKIAALYRCGEEYRLFCIYFPLEICFVGKLLYLCSGKEERCTFKNGRYEFALSLQRIGRDRLQRGRSPRIDKK